MGGWNTTREFLNVEDLSNAIIKILSSKIQNDIINIGSGHLLNKRSCEKNFKNCWIQRFY